MKPKTMWAVMYTTDPEQPVHTYTNELQNWLPMFFYTRTEARHARKQVVDGALFLKDVLAIKKVQIKEVR